MVEVMASARAQVETGVQARMDMVEVGVSIWARFEAMEAGDKRPGSNGHDGGGK